MQSFHMALIITAIKPLLLQSINCYNDLQIVHMAGNKNDKVALSNNHPN